MKLDKGLIAGSSTLLVLSLLEKEETMGETCPREIRERLTQYSDQEVDETWEELRSLQEPASCFPATTIWTRRPPWSCPVRRW